MVDKHNKVVKRNMKTDKSYLEEEAEAHPLIIFDVSSFPVWLTLLYAGVGNVDAEGLCEGCGDCVCGMDPAVCVDDLFGYFFGMYAVYGVANILPCRDDETESKQYHHGNTVMQAEH